jgi:radical SAM superfamily enzyme YgiQ (UPF0313 family)
MGMYDLVLTTCPPWDPFSPSPGLGYLAASLTREGYRAYVHEFNAWLYHRVAPEDRHLWLFENSPLWNDPQSFWAFQARYESYMDTFVDELVSQGTEICGVSVAYTKELCTIELIKKIKARRPEMKVILGGAGSSCDGSRQVYLHSIPELIAAYVIGEGEDTLVEMVRALKSQRPLEGIAGVMVYKNGQPAAFTPRPPIMPLDRLPHPTYEDFRLDGPFDHDCPVFSRGCVANCVFCNVRAIWGPFRTRSPQDIFGEIKFLVEQKNISRFFIYDPAINCHPRTLEGVCDLIIEAGYKLNWTALAMPRKDMGPELFHKMRRAGCEKLEIGVESGSDKIVAQMGKKFRLAEAEDFMRQAHEAGIKVVIFLIVGFPSETERDFHKTVQFLRRNRQHIDIISSINTFMVLDDTPIKRNARQYDIKFPPDRGDLYWYTDDGNTYELRKERAEILASLTREMGIYMVKDNIIR